MDFLKSQLDRIQQQLSGLNASQKMLAACLVAIIVMTVAFWGGRAGTSETVPLYKALDPEEAARIKNMLSMRGIDATIGADNRVSVPIASLHDALSQLAGSEAMPKNRAIDFEAFMKGMNPFQSPSNFDASMNHFKQAQLAEAIRKIRGVKSAMVFINPIQRLGLSGNGVEPSATVTIFTSDPEAISQRVIDGVAGLVKGAQAGLTWSNIIVTVDGNIRRVSDPKHRGGEGPDGLLAVKEKYQQQYSRDIAEFLKIPGLSVRVAFSIDPATTRTRSQSYDQKKSFNLESESGEKTMESIGGGGATPSGEPGAMPNVGMTLAGNAGGAGGATVTESDSKTKFEVFPTNTVKESEKPASLGPATGAAMLVPRSYVVKELKRGRPNAPEPDEAAIEAWLMKKRPSFQDTVKQAVGLASATTVSVDLYSDDPPAQLDDAAVAAAASSTASLAAMAGTHSREIMLGGLAVVSLFMVSMMVRKGGAAVVALPASVHINAPTPLLNATEHLAGEAGESKSMLNAMELDADAVHAQQMVDQVAAMVEDNPDAAAGLVKRWMSRA